MDSKVRTRSRAKSCKEVWEQVSAPLKIMSVLADALLESREGPAKPPPTILLHQLQLLETLSSTDLLAI